MPTGRACHLGLKLLAECGDRAGEGLHVRAGLAELALSDRSQRGADCGRTIRCAAVLPQGGAGVVLAIGATGVMVTAVTGWAVARSSILVDPTGSSLARSAFVAAYAAVGTYTWWRRPTSRLGPVLLGAAVLLSAYSLNASGAPLAYTLGMVLFAVLIVYATFLYLSFPRGRLESGLERAVIRAMALSTAVLWALILALSPTLPAGGNFTDCGSRCPHNALQVVGGHAATGKRSTRSTAW
jgi:hypothetical protein